MENLCEKLHSELEKKLLERQNLEAMFEAQQDIFDEIQQIDCRNEIEEKEIEIEAIEGEITKARDFLENLLNKKPKETTKNEILGKIILQIQAVIIYLEQKSTSSGFCDLREMLILIDQINKVIENLINSKLMIETEEEMRERSKKLDDLGVKVLDLYRK
jgi:hypothetical protein